MCGCTHIGYMIPGLNCRSSVLFPEEGIKRNTRYYSCLGTIGMASEKLSTDPKGHAGRWFTSKKTLSVCLMS